MTHQPSPDRDAECGSPASPDEVVANDEAWTALRQLLDAAQGDLETALGDPAALAGRLHRRIAGRRRRRRTRGLAAAMLLACGAWLAVSRPFGGMAPLQPHAALADVGDWDDDALDLELAWATRKAAAIESQWRRPADALAFVRQQMDALEAEFEGNSL
ncbi:MAG TPA: hypothetical protein VGN42_00625 [Pirellulales bacterium]|jgi:hypothetical protein|nr:hypothetical protein [Pirellulales bacterium]